MTSWSLESTQLIMQPPSASGARSESSAAAASPCSGWPTCGITLLLRLVTWPITEAWEKVNDFAPDSGFWLYLYNKMSCYNGLSHKIHVSKVRKKETFWKYLISKKKLKENACWSLENDALQNYEKRYLILLQIPDLARIRLAPYEIPWAATPTVCF